LGQPRRAALSAPPVLRLAHLFGASNNFRAFLLNEADHLADLIAVEHAEMLIEHGGSPNSDSPLG
jgi:hypothetical protein